MGFVYAGFGLSGLFYAFITQAVLGHDTASLLTMLALIPSGSMLLAWLLLGRHQTGPINNDTKFTTSPAFTAPRPSTETTALLDFADSVAVEKKSRNPTNIGGTRLLGSPEFFMLATIAFCLTGTGRLLNAILETAFILGIGVMWINSVGTMLGELRALAYLMQLIQVCSHFSSRSKAAFRHREPSIQADSSVFGPQVRFMRAQRDTQI